MKNLKIGTSAVAPNYAFDLKTFARKCQSGVKIYQVCYFCMENPKWSRNDLLTPQIPTHAVFAEIDS